MTDLNRPAFGLGRRFAPDPRDHNYRVVGLTPSDQMKLPQAYRYWNANGWWGDQGQTSQCVAYAWCHWLEDGPITHGGIPPIVAPGQLYSAAQEVDEWPGTDYDGTSVRAGAKVLQAKGHIGEYRWAFSLADVIHTLLNEGPMVVGTNWYDAMFEPDEAGFLTLEGPIIGGHAWIVDGINTRARFFRMKNSWGRGWGNNGFALISFDSLRRLLEEDGEACIATEVRS